MQTIVYKEMGGKKSTSFVGGPSGIKSKTNILKIFNDTKINKYITNSGSAYFFTHKQVKADIYFKKDNESDEKTRVMVCGSKIHPNGEIDNF